MEQDLLVNLFFAMERPGSEENEYVMKAVMRSFSTLQEAVIPHLAGILPRLTEKLGAVARNPTKPHFNHYLFETLSLSIRIVCKSNRSAVCTFEAALFPVFQGILQQDVQEFVPYVFQVLSLLLELHSGEGAVPEPYMAMFPFLLVPILWERPANIHPLVRLLQAFIQTGGQQVITVQIWQWRFSCSFIYQLCCFDLVGFGVSEARGLAGYLSEIDRIQDERSRGLLSAPKHGRVLPEGGAQSIFEQDFRAAISTFDVVEDDQVHKIVAGLLLTVRHTVRSRGAGQDYRFGPVAYVRYGRRTPFRH